MRDDGRTFRRAIGVSLVLHLLLLFLVVPRLRDAWSSSSVAPIFAVDPNQPAARQPLEFEFVDLAEDREEKADKPEAPMSDLDRRAHGGEGAAADRPSTRGNTPQLVQADGGDVFNRGAPPQVPGPQAQQVPRPQPEEQQVERPDDREPRENRPEGSGEGKPSNTAEQPAVPLPPPGVWQLPPAEGGVRENPDRDGGLVDTGGLSFDTQWYDWGPYAKLMLAKIRRHWEIPQIARMGVSGIVKIRFYIEKDGKVTGLTVLDESGKPPMDNAAWYAIADSSPFNQLPPGLGETGPEGVTITFLYNVKPQDRGR